MPVAFKDILIVDDDKDIRVLMRKMLEVVGARVIEYDTVAGALEYTLQSPPHLILLDLKMPGHTGYDFLKARNRSRMLQKVPVIVVSGSRDKNSVYQAIALGAADYVVKPLQTKVLLQKVRKYLKDNAFFVYKFTIGERPKANMLVNAEIISFNKTHFKLDAPIKIEKNATIKMESRFLNNIGCGNVAIKSANYPAMYLDNKRYINTVQFVGASAEEIKKITQAMKKFG